MQVGFQSHAYMVQAIMYSIRGIAMETEEKQS